uniref:Uncharacterized protein n=1 Tax=Kalanchoe fedtschenkoi TaxID=63787 RepID=A0A7N0UG77_KALFE
MSSSNLARGSAEFLQAQSHIYKHIFSFISSISLKCAVELGIPDIINSHSQPMTLPKLVSALQLPRSKTGHVHRLMRLLVHNGFFARESVDEATDQGYVLTHSARFLLKGSGSDLSPFVLSMLHPDLVLPWHVLGDSIKDDRATPFEAAHGTAFWEFQQKNKHFRELFNEAMASDSRLVSLVVKDCRAAFEGLDSIVDVGGGTGTTMKIISQEFPHLKCTVLDLPQVVAGLPSSPSFEFVAGDMFASIPSADAFLIKLVLHSLGDEECVKILK